MQENIDQTHDRKMVEEAKQILDSLVSHQKNSVDRLSQFEKQVDELKRAQRLMEESRFHAEPQINAEEKALANFVRKDGSIRWEGEAGTVDTPAGRMKVEHEGLLDGGTLCNQWHKELIKTARERSLIRTLMRDPHTPKLDARLAKHMQLAPANIKPAIEKAMYDGAGVGAGWVPDQFRAQLFEEYKTPRVVRSLFSEIQMDRNVLLVPKMDRGGRPYIKGQVTSDSPANYTASTIATSQKTITTSGLATRFVIDDALAEDSAIALLPALQRQIAQDLADAIEDTLINGDAAVTHQDDIANWDIRSRWGSVGLGGSSDHRRAWTGLRAQAFDRSTTLDTSAATYAKLLELMANLGELNASNRVLITSPENVINNLLGMAEVKTVDVFGPAATILTGQIASLAGMPVVLSRYMSADLAATGLFTGSGATTGMLVVARDSYNIFSRRGVVVEQDKDITAGAINLVSTERLTFDSLDATSTKNVAFGFNMAT